MLIVESETVIKAVQGKLDEMWKLVDDGEPKGKVVLWLRKGGHRTISDWVATEVAMLIERGMRSASVVKEGS